MSFRTTFGSSAQSNWNASKSYGRGRGGGFSIRGGRPGAFPPGPKPDIVKNPLGPLLCVISDATLDEASEPFLMTDCEYIASYNWMNESAPTITVPGMPALWTPLNKPQQLMEDSGTFYRDPNAARFPSYPIEPAVQAIYQRAPSFRTSNIEIFACGSTLGNLLRFTRAQDRPFRFAVERIGNTVFFVRKENSPREVIEGVRGYGHTFPDAYTSWEESVKGSETHQRLIQYTFGGVKCIVRYECDGYLDALANKKQKSNGPGTVNDDDLLSAIGKISVGQQLPSVDSPLHLRTGGSEVPQSLLFDLKTRSGKHGYKTIDMSDVLPSLYLKQIPNFIIAYHDGSGTFPKGDIHVQNVRDQVRSWELQNKTALQRVANLLRQIIKIAKEHDTDLLEVYYETVGQLEIRKQYSNGSHALPKTLRDQWEGMGYSDSEDDGESKSSTEDVEDGGIIFSQNNYDSIFDNDSDGGSKDFTACSANTCGYCGECTY